MRVTIKQVAREAGVSIATVSRVSSGKGPVNEVTRRRILAVARRLRYVPHVGAQSLITRCTKTIGVLLPDVHGQFFSELLRGIDGAARRHGYHLLVSGFHGDPAELEAGLRATRDRVDGLLAVASDVPAGRFSRNLPDGLPVVLLAGSRTSATAFDTITIDNDGGAVSMVRHLASLGHRRIAFVKGPERNADARERLRGYRRALRAIGGVRSRALELDGDFSEDSGFSAGERVARLDPRPTAVFAANDAMAIGVLSALRDGGLAVPADVALVGFDDIPLARYLTPALTTVRVSMEDLGLRAMERLLAILDKGGRPPRHETLPTALVVRASCGGAASALRSARRRTHSVKMS